MKLSIGDKAPDVTLFEKTPDAAVKSFKLSDDIGKQNLVLLFFPAVFTGTCTKEMCTIRDTTADYDALDAKVIGISGDLPYSQLVWKQQLNLNMTLASDFNHDAVRAYDVEYPTWAGGIHGVAKRASFVIDKQGFVKYAEILEDAGSLPNFEAIKKALSSLN
jgi:glutaredoxin-dependent peroxiredoxin